MRRFDFDPLSQFRSSTTPSLRFQNPNSLIFLNMMSYKENLQKCHEYVKALEEEKRKIEMFQRELPLCLEIVTSAIETCRQQLSGSGGAGAGDCLNGQSECSERTASDGPAFEEFMPMKRSCSSAENEGEDEEEEEEEFEFRENSGKKEDWLRSAQLWNQSPDPTSAKEINKPRRVPVVEVKTKVGAPQNTMAMPAPPPAPAASDCSTAERVAGNGCKAGKDGGPPQARKSRRCWSPELHRRFLNALEHLGGSHVATPKQIRDHMKVEGLTNDEVKSHLQKYRLHSSRPSPSLTKSANKQTHFMLVGGVWSPPPRYATTTTAPTAPPMPMTLKQASQSTGSHSEGDVARCNSSETSDSARAITTSPAY